MRNVNSKDVRNSSVQTCSNSFSLWREKTVLDTKVRTYRANPWVVHVMLLRSYTSCTSKKIVYGWRTDFDLAHRLITIQSQFQ